MALADTRLTEFLPLVAHHAPHCPRSTIERALRDSAIAFCESTRIWRHLITATLTSGQNVALVAPEFSVIHEIEHATHNGNDLIPLGYTDVGPDELTGQADTGVPRYITQISPDSVAVYPFMPGTLRLSVFLKPVAGRQLYGTDPLDTMHDAYNMVPEFFLTQHGATIAAGALARLFSIPSEAWTDPQRAGFYMQEFERACAAGKQRAFKGQQRAPLRTQPRWM